MLGKINIRSAKRMALAEKQINYFRWPFLDFFLDLVGGGDDDLRFFRDLREGDSLEVEDEPEPEPDDELDDRRLFLLDDGFRLRSVDEERGLSRLEGDLDRDLDGDLDGDRVRSFAGKEKLLKYQIEKSSIAGKRKALKNNF